MSNDITANSLSATAETGIAAVDDVLETAISNLAATTGTGGIFVKNAGALTITVVGSVTGVTITGASGNISVVAASPLTINSAVSGPGDILEQAGDSAAPGDVLTINASITSTGGGTIDLIAGDDINQTVGTITSTAGAGARLVRFKADNEGAGVADADRGSISQTGGNIVATNLVFRALAAVNVTSSTNNATNLAASVTGSGFGFEYRDADSLTVTTVDGVTGLTTIDAKATICVVLGNLTLAQNISVDTGTVRLQADATGSAILDVANYNIRITDLPAGLLSLSDMLSHTISLDVSADGFGWYLDADPGSDHEFLGASPAPAGMDLLTVITHEFGHLLGIAEADPLAFPHHIMRETLPTGTRRLTYPLSATAEIEVRSGRTSIVDGISTLSLGETPLVTRRQQSFVIKNTGLTPLTLGAITVPTGFSVASGFGTDRQRTGSRHVPGFRQLDDPCQQGHGVSGR